MERSEPARIEFNRREVNRALLATAFALLSEGRPIAIAVRAAPTRLFDFAIAGGYYHGLRQALPDLRPGDMLTLRREPRNPDDADAVAVHRADGLMLGYVPRAANTPIARLLDRGTTVRAEIVRMLSLERNEDVPADLVFTSLASGDPAIRLTAEDSVT